MEIIQEVTKAKSKKAKKEKKEKKQKEKKEKKKKKEKNKKEKKKKLSTDQVEVKTMFPLQSYLIYFQGGSDLQNAGKSKGPMTKEEWEALEKKRKMATNYAPDEKKKRLEANMREEKEKFGTEWTWLLSGDQKIPPPHLRAEMKYQNSFQGRFWSLQKFSSKKVLLISISLLPNREGVRKSDVFLWISPK